MNYIFFDIECANCFHGNGKICSFVYVITDEKFNVIKKRDIVINPHAKFHLTGHGNHPGIVLAYEESEFRSSPIFPFYYAEIRNLLENNDNLVFGFSVISDANYIKSECQRYKKKIFDYEFIDVQRIYTDMHNLSNTPSLIKCASEYGVTQTQDVHKSDDDALFTMHVMKGMCEELNLSVNELIEKFPNGKCWCKDGEIDTEYNRFKEAQKANKLSKMEKLTNSKRSNWMYGENENFKIFSKYISKVFVNYSSSSLLCGKKLCISNLYEEFNFKEMMNIVSTLAKLGVRYTQKSYRCDIFVTYSLTNKKGENYECFRLKKLNKAILEDDKEVEFISFDDFLKIIGLNQEMLENYDEKLLSPIRKKSDSKK